MKRRGRMDACDWGGVACAVALGVMFVVIGCDVWSWANKCKGVEPKQWVSQWIGSREILGRNDGFHFEYAGKRRITGATCEVSERVPEAIYMERFYAFDKPPS